MRFLKNCRLSVRKGERPEAIILYLGLLSKEETSARLWNEELLSLPGSEYSQSFYPAILLAPLLKCRDDRCTVHTWLSWIFNTAFSLCQCQ